MELNDIFSLTFYFAFTIYIVIGLYASFLPLKYPLKFLFVMLCVVLALWSFALAIMNSNASPREAFVWRRSSIVCFAFAYPLFLYYILTISGYANLLKKRILFAVFTPAVILSLIFALFTPTASIIFSVIRTRYGCVAVTDGFHFQLILNLYYIGYLSFILFFSFRIYLKAVSSQNKIKSRFLFISFIIVLIINLTNDIVLYFTCDININSISVFSLLLPVILLLYISFKYYVTGIDPYTGVENKIYSGKYFPRKQIFRTIAYLYIQLGLLNIGMAYILVQIDVKEGVFVGIYAVITGIVSLLVQKSKLSKKKADFFCIILVVLSIPVILFTYYSSAALTVWAFPLGLLLVSILFSSLLFLRLVSIVTLICYVLMLAFTSNVTVVLGSEEHVFRIILFIAGTYVAAYIQKMYKMRFSEIQRRTQIQRIIFEISHILLRSSLSNIEEYIGFALRIIGTFFDVDKVFLYRFVSGERQPVRLGFWMNQELLSEAVYNEKHTADYPAFCLSQLRAKKKIIFSDVSSQVFLSKKEKDFFTRRNIQSSFAVPLLDNENAVGFLGVHMIKRHRIWKEDDNQIFRIFANLFATAVLKVENEKHIEYMAYHDALTGLPNRIYFNHLVSSEIKNRKEYPFTILFIDLDSFKNINDSKGHEYGDKVLLQTSQRLKKDLPIASIVSRFGGDEFLIFLPGISSAEKIEAIVTKMMKTLTAPMKIREEPLFVTFSCGIAIFPKDGKTVNTLIKHADSAMYASKMRGKNCYTFCSSDLKKKIATKSSLHQQLFTAVEKDELVLYYQPQVDVVSGKIFGVEALLHWANENFGIVSPSVFIPLSEQNGIIISIGNWVLRKACEQLHKWNQMGIKDLSMAINVSGRQFIADGLVPYIESLIHEFDLDPGCIDLEITENVYISHDSTTGKIMSDLKKLGVKISIDDFATEYSSVKRLKLAPIDKIKISDEFISGIGEDEKDEAIVKSIISLAKNLKVKVVAEGVEKESQLDFLTENHCTLIQGFYFSKPLPPESLDDMLKSALPPPPPPPPPTPHR
ncbi:EAL domain-containing protein [Treponema sp. HNW]|uniref:EAL domain-containing protein n=1 Tax=Treponema sp. HNW TaxID=3116654 RepID=UPI003D112382